MPLTDYLIHSITLRHLGATDSYGEPGIPTDVVTAARVEFDRKLVLDSNGEETVATGRVWIPVGVAMGPRDQMLFEGVWYRILSHDRYEGWGVTDTRSHWMFWFV